MWLLFSTTSYAQLWTGIISSSRAVDWSTSGVLGGLPDASWTQCGSTVTTSTSLSALNTQLAGCSANQYVLMEPGTYNYSGTINIPSNTVLRGSGASSTFIVETGGSGGCNGMGASIAICGANSSTNAEQNVCDWTAGYSSGTTVITLANCGSTRPAAGSLSNLKVGSVLVLDQADEYSDTGTIWNCAEGSPPTASGAGVCGSTTQGGDARTDGPCAATECQRSQQQVVTVTGISGSNITISPGIYMPNWRTGQLPQAWFGNSVVSNAGVENLSIDQTNATGSRAFAMMNCYNCWISGVRSLYSSRDHAYMYECVHCTIQNSYFYQNVSHYDVSYGVELGTTDNSLVQNNIFQQVTDSTPSCTGACEGNVMAYNLGIDTQFVTATWFQASFYQHASGDALNLWEGNIGTGYMADAVHGTHHFETIFRNRFQGWQNLCDGSSCTAQTVPINLYAGSRYMNVIGNILGETGYHNNYQCNATSTASCPDGRTAAGMDTSIYYTGYTGNGAQEASSQSGFCTSPSCSSTNAYDPQVGAYLFRWGNYDVVNASNQFNSNEVPSGIALYSNPVPSSQTLPASFYLSSPPSWWPSGKPWPVAGPDVSNGNLGRCSGGTYAGALATSNSQCATGSLVADVSGQANSIPAMDCAFNVMGMPPDGSGGVLVFNAASCYGSSTPAASPAPPTGLTAVVK
jgi:hypothetical protein